MTANPTRVPIQATEERRFQNMAPSKADRKRRQDGGRLRQVHPSGFAQNIQDGIIRARHRESLETSSLIEPGRVYRYEIDLWASSNVFLRGHRMRVEITSSNFPRFDRNPNTGRPFGDDEEKIRATQTIFHTSQYPSHIVLPVIPASTPSDAQP